MDTGKFVGLLLAFLVGALVLVAFVPIIEETTSETKTFENEGLYYMENPTEAVTMKYLGNAEWEINGEPLTYTSIGATNVIVTESFFVRNNGQVMGSLWQTWDTAEITIDNGTITGTFIRNETPGTVNTTYTDICIVTTEKSDLIMKNPSVATYFKSDSIADGMGITTVKDSDGVNQLKIFKIHVENMTATVTTESADITIDNVQLNTVAVNGYNDLYLFSSVTFNAVAGDYTTACTYNIVIVPSEVTAEKTIHPDSTLATIIDLLPFIAGVGLLMGAVAYFLRRY